MKKRGSYLLHPISIGLVISIVVNFLLARYLPGYVVELTDEALMNNDRGVYYFDIDNDGDSEKLHLYQYDRIFMPTLYFYDSQNNFINLWNFLESPIEKSEVFVDDYNLDNHKEIFVFTEKSDSLFLNVLSKSDKQFNDARVFVTKIKNRGLALNVIPLGLYDLHGNNNKEFLFAVNEFSQATGSLFLLDVENKKLLHKKEFNVEIIKPVIVDDINSDGIFEITVSNKSFIAKDSEAQFIQLDNNLNFKFDPMVFQGEPSRFTSCIINHDNKKYIAALNSGISPDQVFNSLSLYNENGEQIKEKSLSEESNLSIISPLNPNGYIWAVSDNSILQFLPATLQQEKKVKVCNCESLRFIRLADLTGDGKQELVFKNNSNLFVVSEDLKDKSKIKIRGEGKLTITRVQRKDKANQVSVQVGKKIYLYEFYKNEAFFYSNIFHIFVFVIITFIVFMLKLLKDRLKRSNRALFGTDQTIKELENNLEEKFTDLKSEVHKMSSKIEADSYKEIIYNIDETLNKIKNPSGNLMNKKDLKEFLESLVQVKKEKLDISYYIFPEDEVNDVKSEIIEIIVDFCNSCTDIIGENNQGAKIVLQLIKQEEKLDLLIEIEDVFLAGINISEDLNKRLSDYKGIVELNTYDSFGTIISVEIPTKLEIDQKQNEEQKIKVIIAEDHDVSLFGLVSLLKTKEDIELVGTAKNGMEVLKLLETKDADIVVTDISMPGMDGIELSERLKNEYPKIKVIVFTMYMENWFVEQLTNNGAKGFVSKNSKIVELLSAVRNVYEGNNYYCPQFKSKFGFNNGNGNGNGNGISKKLDSLTKTELQIVKLFAENMDRMQIAKTMNLNLHTLNIFIANILLKLKAGDEEEIIHIAKKQKFISE